MSVKASAPVLGFNHNLKFGPRIYHVQTEDSGLPHAHYITHLFVGGNILASMKASYAENADDPDLQKTVRSLMEGQHKQMVRRLVAGEFNEKVEAFAQHYEPGVLASGESSPAAVNTAPTAPASVAAPTIREMPKVAKPAPAHVRPGGPVPAGKPSPAKGPPTAPAIVKPLPPRPAPAPVMKPPPPPAARPPLAPQQRPAARMPGAPLPPTIRLPPTQLPMGPPPVVPMPPRAPPAPMQAAPPLSRNPFAPESGFVDESIVEVPADGIPTLFAEELISEKSLDEVILAFLSADLEQPK